MDIGGTNLRLAQLDEVGGLTRIESWPCSRFSGPAEALAAYFQQHALHDVRLCLAVASPVEVDPILMTNLHWQFSRQDLVRSLDLAQLLVINDYHAMGLAVTALADGSLVQIGGGQPDLGKPALVCGPGTGLGVSTLVPVGDSWLVLPGEGGHVDFAPTNETEQQIWNWFHARFGHVSAERVLSGSGLENLYLAISELQGQPTLSKLTASEITVRALTGQSEICVAALSQFCASLGAFCGNLALQLAAFGGIYVTGGMVPRFVDFLAASAFRARFDDKGRYRSYNQRIPTYVVTHPYPGLLGAAEFLSQKPGRQP